MSTAVVPPRPAAVPPRPAAPPVAGAAAIPAAVVTAPPAAAPVAATPPAVAPVAVAPVAATPATTTTRKPRGRKASTRTLYHGVVEYGPDNQPIMDTVGEGEAATQVVRRKKLDTLPTDFDAVKHEKLMPGDFANEALYYEFREAESNKSAQKFGAIAKRLRALGNVSDQKSATKLLKMREQMELLAKQLGPEAVAALLNGQSVIPGNAA